MRWAEIGHHPTFLSDCCQNKHQTINGKLKRRGMIIPAKFFDKESLEIELPQEIASTCGI
jgi:hypothetical protein